MGEWPPKPRPKPAATAKPAAKPRPTAKPATTAKSRATSRPAGAAAKAGAATKPETTRTARRGAKRSSKHKAKREDDTGRRKATARAALGSVVLVGLLFVFVYPTRTFLDQRADTSKARTQLELLRSENAKLARETKKLQSDAEVERRARAYGLVKPGEQPFVIIPAPSTAPAATTPTAGTPQAAP